MATKLIFEQFLGDMKSLINVFPLFFARYCLEQWKWIIEMDRGFKLKQLHKFGTLIGKIKVIGPNLKYGISFGSFM